MPRLLLMLSAGDTSGMILNAMPPGSELIIYGGLSGKPVGMVNPLDIIFKAKTIRGFNLGDWKKEVGDEHFQKVSDELQELMIRQDCLSHGSSAPMPLKRLSRPWNSISAICRQGRSSFNPEILNSLSSSMNLFLIPGGIYQAYGKDHNGNNSLS